ncbi:hypothetical protein AB0J75_40460, partial [Streptomyces sp. NPDC049744]
AARTGPAGGLRTHAAARTGWGSLVRLMRFLDSLPQPPTVPGELTPEHVTAFHAHRMATSPATARQDLIRTRLLFSRPGLREQVAPQVIDHLRRRLPVPRTPMAATGTAAPPATDGTKRLTSGYSDGELARLMAALRADAGQIRDRIRAGEDILRRYQRDPQALDEEDRALGRMLEQMAATGQVPTPPGARPNPFAPERLALAGRLFLTLRDLPPIPPETPHARSQTSTSTTAAPTANAPASSPSPPNSASATPPSAVISPNWPSTSQSFAAARPPRRQA